MLNKYLMVCAHLIIDGKKDQVYTNIERIKIYGQASQQVRRDQNHNIPCAPSAWEIASYHFTSHKKNTAYVFDTLSPWTPKPWNMKVLHPQNMGYNL